MKLLDLEPQGLKLAGAGEPFVWRHCDFADADGVMFLCPVCFKANGGAVGTHVIVCWRPRVPPSVRPGPGRWEWQGSSFADVTFVAGSSSVLLTGGCHAHFFVRDGEIVPC
jgi:hypothetical protein